jgi:hypothetical protein
VPKIREYSCDCGNRFEYMHMTDEDLAKCPSCGNPVTSADEMLGGHSCTTIVPMSRTSLKNKAGYVHTHADRPAEKGSVSVPRNKGDI